MKMSELMPSMLPSGNVPLIFIFETSKSKSKLTYVVEVVADYALLRTIYRPRILVAVFVNNSIFCHELKAVKT